MKLATPFCRLPLRFDVARLQAEIAAFSEGDWKRHPSGYQGNSAIRLISADGGENDRVSGRMLPTKQLDACPYIRQVLSQFGVVWSRSRLMRLGPRSVVPEHADVNYHWYSRIRIHIPIRTHPAVLFTCGDQSVHMAAGECWIFDNWRPHQVENGSDETRVHLVADTVGTSAFWDLAARGETDWSSGPRANTAPVVPFAGGASSMPLLTERFNTPAVMPPAEIEALVADLCADLADPGDASGTSAAVRSLRALCIGFVREWKAMWALHGDLPEGRKMFRSLCDRCAASAQRVGPRLVMASNQMSALEVLQARVLEYAVQADAATTGAADEPAEYTKAPVRRSALAGSATFDRPVFIVAAPRSGSTLLYETLAVTPQFQTLGGEAHWLVESIPALCPGAPGVDSNRLGAGHATPGIAAKVADQLVRHLRAADGEPLAATGGSPVRFLEKTPKNALRIPFFDRLFPDARFIFLWRDPRENIASIIEAWNSGGWVTYPELPGWDGPWSLLLPPGWQALRGKPLADVAAFQWESTNRIILDDLARLKPDRWCAVEYASLLHDPSAVAQRLAAFAGIEFDASLAQRVAAPLPLSRYTNTPPESSKWRKHEEEIGPVIAALTPTLQRLSTLETSRS